jgi:hypothetical protein
MTWTKFDAGAGHASAFSECAAAVARAQAALEAALAEQRGTAVRLGEAKAAFDAVFGAAEPDR